VIVIDHITKQFGAFAAVDDLSLTVGPGEFFGFLGPNGAGKTTTIKMMTGLFTPTRGSITINGYDIVRSPLDAKRTFGYIPDHSYLYDKLTGREFLLYIGALHELPKAAAKANAERMIDELELGAWIDKRTEDYSQGMRQRVTFAAAFVHEPKTIIIDEPMVGLDPRSARIVKDMLVRRTNEGAAVFMSTHILEMADELCTRIGIIHKGRMIFMGSRDDLHAQKAKYDGRIESVFLELTKDDEGG
jgi:ABC-2 type transport system ATP-binding protein